MTARRRHLLTAVGGWLVLGPPPRVIACLGVTAVFVGVSGAAYAVDRRAGR